MAAKLIDTNVLVRFLVETPATVPEKFRGVFTFFPKVERGDLTVELPELVLFQAFFVLTSHYKVPTAQAAATLSELVRFRGIVMTDKTLILDCLHTLVRQHTDLVDAYLLALAKKRHVGEVYSFDRDLAKAGLTVLEVN